MKHFQVSFGSGHLCGFGISYHLDVDAPDELTLRKVVNKLTDGHWSSVYPSTFYGDTYGTKSLGTLIITDEEQWETRATV